MILGKFHSSKNPLGRYQFEQNKKTSDKEILIKMDIKILVNEIRTKNIHLKYVQ